MKYTTLKKTSIQISEIGFGTNAVGGHNNYANVNEDIGKQTVRKAIEQGIARGGTDHGESRERE